MLLDQSVDDNNFDANLEHLYYPFGRHNGGENIANDHGFDDEDPHFGDEDIPLVVTASATTATEGVTLDDGLDYWCDEDDKSLPEEWFSNFKSTF